MVHRVESVRGGNLGNSNFSNWGPSIRICSSALLCSVGAGCVMRFLAVHRRSERPPVRSISAPVLGLTAPILNVAPREGYQLALGHVRHAYSTVAHIFGAAGDQKVEARAV
jgi:hypothetical protein